MASLHHHEIPDRVTLFTGHGKLPAIRVQTDTSEAEIYLHGAHITSFRRKNQIPLLFLSSASSYVPEKPIRGGVPIIFPWFGPRDGQPSHGTARITAWDLTESLLLPDGSVRLSFHLPTHESADVAFIVTVGHTLTMELTVTNTSTADITFENCLHTYFHVGNIQDTYVSGLQGTPYIDDLTATEHIEEPETIHFTAETDRLYQNTSATVEIHDPSLRRTIQIRKTGSLSTVVWNPWIDKAKRLPDLGDDEWPHMLCVESGNLKQHAITLPPAARSSLKVEIDSQAT